MAMISPSLLAADLSHLSEEIKKVRSADLLHIDVMDGVFVPNITFGVPLMEALSRIDTPPLDVHLMIEDASRYAEEYISLGASILTVHVEAVTHLHRLICNIRDKGAEAFVSLNPHTPVSLLEEILPVVDGVLVMTVNPGFTAQRFIASVAGKVKKLDFIRNQSGLRFKIAVDGGVDLSNASSLVSDGADILVMGAAVFRSNSPGEVVQKVKELRR
jgi:ribulose-phosphate 3-epimerase